MSSLFLTHSDGSETEVPLGEEILRIGRAAENEIVLDDGSVSTFHAEIHREGEHHVLKDLGSTNGVRLNGERVNEAKLSDGDLLRFGNLRARYEGDATPAMAPATPAAPSASAPPAPADGLHAPPPAVVKPSSTTVPDVVPLGFGPKKKEIKPDKIIAVLAGVIVILTSAAAALMAFSMR